MEEVRAIVKSVVLEVARQHDESLTAVEDDHSLANDLSFDSLDLAQVAAALESRLGLDPFAQEAASRIATVKDLVTLFERAAAAKGVSK